MAEHAFHVRSLQGGSVTAVDARSGRAFSRHSHEEFGIGLMIGGAQRSWSGRGPVEAERGDLITVNPAELHDGAPVGPDRAWSMLYLSSHLVGAAVADISEGRLSTGELHAPVLSDPKLRRLFIATRTAALERDANAAFEQHLLGLLGLLFRVAPVSSRALSPALLDVRQQIDSNPAAPHRLADLAALAGLSRFQTLRGFARLTGLTPHAYVVQRRLDRARRMIRGGMRLADASAAAGFADQSHMHRAFVARHGFTPGAYARAFRP